MRQLKSLLLIPVTILYIQKLYAQNYDLDLLNTYSKLSPRFVLMSTQKDTIEEEMKICVLHVLKDKRIAESFIEMAKNNYPEGIMDYEIKFIESSYEQVSICKSAQVLFLLNTDDDSLKKVLAFSNSHKILSISYDKKLQEQGADIYMIF